jgi:hypothetical protein
MNERYFRFNFAFYGMMRRLIIFLCLFIPAAYFSTAQEPDVNQVQKDTVPGNDTIIYQLIPEITVHPQHEVNTPRMERQYSRLVLKVKKVYPYALLANELLKKYEPEYLALKTDRERRKLMKKVEEQLMDEYMDDLKKMSISDGRILIKLIDRQTGKTGYTLIKEFRGNISAAFWQGIARIFKNNLKDEYDRYGEDIMIEEIVTLIESGYL